MVSLFAVGCSSFAFGCNGANGVATQAIVVTDQGGTCGEWQLQNASPETLVKATCATGMECAGPPLLLYPMGESERRLGICLPNDALSCDAAGTQGCPHDLTCLGGDLIPPPGRCYVGCQTATDCPPSFQSCVDGACMFVRCDGEAGGGCPAGTQCDGVICRT